MDVIMEDREPLSHSCRDVVPAVAPDFGSTPVRSQTLVKEGGDVLIECKPKMSPWGIISWKKTAEPLRESNR